MNKISYYLYYSIYEQNRLLVAERLSAVRQQKTHFNNSLRDSPHITGDTDWSIRQDKVQPCVHERLSDALSTYFDLTSLKCFQNSVSILV